MFWINVLFWAVVVISMSISSRKPSFSYGYQSLSFDEYMEAGNYEYALYHLLNSIRMERYDIDDMMLRLKNDCSTSVHLSDRIFGKFAYRIALLARTHKGWNNSLANMAVCLAYCCYDSIKTIFTICCFITIFGHTHYSYLLDYMESSDKIAYYAIPITVFVVVLLACIYVFKKEMGWQISRYAFIIAFFVSFPLAVCTHNWTDAYEDYSEYMEEELGEDWEEELEDARNDAIYRRP